MTALVRMPDTDWFLDRAVAQAGLDDFGDLPFRAGLDALLWAARSAATWYPGAMIHLIGSQVIDPLDDGRMRCRSYAAFLGLDAGGAPVLKGYGTYDDVWASDEGEWRLAHRETVMYGYTPAVARTPAVTELSRISAGGRIAECPRTLTR